MLFFGLDCGDSCGRDARYTKGCCKEKKDLHDDGLIRRERRDAGRSLELVVVGKDISREGKKKRIIVSQMSRGRTCILRASVVNGLGMCDALVIA